jgi:4-hydroxybenzoate polyprenyltransferase
MPGDKHLLDYFFITRPILFFPGWATMLAGFISALGKSTIIAAVLDGNAEFYFWSSTIFLALLAFAMAMGGSFILNQLKDIHSDKKNRKLFIIGEGYVPVKHGYIEGILLLLFSLIIGLLIGIRFTSILILFIFVTSYLYNYQPFKFKNRPIAGLITNMLMGWLAFNLGWVLVKMPDINMLINSLPYLTFNTSLYLFTTLPDVEGDQATHKVTFAVRYGMKNTILFSLFFYLFTILLSLILNDQIVLSFSIILAPLFIILLFKQDVRISVIALKLGILFFCLIICVSFPSFFILMLSIFVLTKNYYKTRFNFDYPNFRGV